MNSQKYRLCVCWLLVNDDHSDTNVHNPSFSYQLRKEANLQPGKQEAVNSSWEQEDRIYSKRGKLPRRPGKCMAVDRTKTGCLSTQKEDSIKRRADIRIPQAVESPTQKMGSYLPTSVAGLLANLPLFH